MIWSRINKCGEENTGKIKTKLSLFIYLFSWEEKYDGICER